MLDTPTLAHYTPAKYGLPANYTTLSQFRDPSTVAKVDSPSPLTAAGHQVDLLSVNGPQFGLCRISRSDVQLVCVTKPRSGTIRGRLNVLPPAYRFGFRL
jgi:hypothetical protein